MAELADDSGPSPTPRERALVTLDQNFYGLSVNTHANTVIFRLEDEDSYAGKWGGGYTWDPPARPKPQYSVAQELAVAVAAKYGLKVIFAINFSVYHVQTDDTFGAVTPTRGAYHAIHALIDPWVYYGSLLTTKLQVVGLSNRYTHTFMGDTRIVGWQFHGEWPLDPTQPWFAAFLGKYWDFFYVLVHWNGANSSFAGIYTQAAPDGQQWNDYPTCSPARLGNPAAQTWSPAGRIRTFKQFFQGQAHRPDVYGFQWYGNVIGSLAYDLRCVDADVRSLARMMRDDVYGVPTAQIALMEGGTAQVSSPYLHDFFVKAADGAANVDGVATRGMSAYESDATDNHGYCGLWDDPGQAPYALNKVTYPITSCTWNGCRDSTGGCSLWPGPPQGWHMNETPGSLTTDNWPAGWGRKFYFDQTASGWALTDAFNQHR
jgi:hypothetical protein